MSCVVAEETHRLETDRLWREGLEEEEELSRVWPRKWEGPSRRGAAPWEDAALTKRHSRLSHRRRIRKGNYRE